MGNGRLPIHESEAEAAAALPGLAQCPPPQAPRAGGHGEPQPTKAPGDSARSNGASKTDGAPVQIDVAELHPSGSNRKRISEEKMRSLEASVAEVGVLVPLIVRRAASGYEIVCGERRWRSIEGANALRMKANEERIRAGLMPLELILKLPCVVRSMTDEEVIQAQCIENAQREDVSPLDEADAYAALEKLGRTTREIARMVGTSHATVSSRLKLLKLTPDAVRALEDGALSESTALIVARKPAAIQKRILETLISGRERPMTVDELSAAVAERFTVDLTKAQFDRTACRGCTHRSGNCRAEYPDVQSADICMDPDCYRAKRDSAAATRIHKLVSDGYEELGKRDSGKAFVGESLSAAYVEMDADHPSQDSTWEALVSKAEKSLPDNAPRIAKLALLSPGGRVVRAYERTAAERLLAKPEPPKQQADRPAKRDADSQKAESERVTRAGVAAVVAGRLAERAKVSGLELPSRKLLLDSYVGDDGPASEACLEACMDFLGIESDGELARRIPKLDQPKTDALLAIAAMDAGGAFDVVNGYPDALTAFAELLGLDLRDLETRVRALDGVAQPSDASDSGRT